MFFYKFKIKICIFKNEKVEYTGNPMEDFTLMHFLDRFVYKKPKDMKKKGK
jgi:ribosome biogenesis protein MAK21